MFFGVFYFHMARGRRSGILRFAMPELHEIHAKIRDARKEKKKISDVFRDMLAQSKPYQDALEELNTLKAKKHQIETELKNEFQKELEEIEKIGQEMKANAELLSDMALTKMMKGETVEITDENDVKYQPIFRVSFKKAE